MKKKCNKNPIILFLTTLGLFCMLFAFNSFAETITIGYFEWPPLLASSSDPAKPIGPMVDFYEKFAKKMNVTVQWKGPLPVPRALGMIEDNELDGIIFLTKNPDREKILLYPKKSIYDMIPSISFRTGEKVEAINDWKELKKLGKVGILFGTGFHKKLSKKYPELHLSEIRMEENPIKYAVDLLIKKEIDVFIHSDQYMVDSVLKKANLVNKVKSIKAPAKIRPLYNVFSKKKKGLVERYNAIIDQVKYE